MPNRLRTPLRQGLQLPFLSFLTNLTPNPKEEDCSGLFTSKLRNWVHLSHEKEWGCRESEPREQKKTEKFTKNQCGIRGFDWIGAVALVHWGGKLEMKEAHYAQSELTRKKQQDLFSRSHAERSDYWTTVEKIQEAGLFLALLTLPLASLGQYSLNSIY